MVARDPPCCRDTVLVRGPVKDRVVGEVRGVEGLVFGVYFDARVVRLNEFEGGKR